MSYLHPSAPGVGSQPAVSRPPESSDPSERLPFARLPVVGVQQLPEADLWHAKALLVLEVQAGSEPPRSAYLVYMKQLLCIKIWSLLGDTGA